MSIYLRIKQLRERNKLTQKAVSVLINVDSSQYSKIELGKLQPTLSQLMEISSHFNVSMDWLCFGKDFVGNNENTNDIQDRLKDKEVIIAGLERERVLNSKEITRLEKKLNNLKVENDKSHYSGALDTPIPKYTVKLDPEEEEEYNKSLKNK